MAICPNVFDVGHLCGILFPVNGKFYSIIDQATEMGNFTQLIKSTWNIVKRLMSMPCNKCMKEMLKGAATRLSDVNMS